MLQNNYPIVKTVFSVNLINWKTSLTKLAAQNDAEACYLHLARLNTSQDELKQGSSGNCILFSTMGTDVTGHSHLCHVKMSSIK